MRESSQCFRSTQLRFIIIVRSNTRKPIYVYSADHVRAHVFLCILAYYVQWHMRRRLTPLLFEDDNPEATRAQRQSPVGKAQVSESAKSKSALKKTVDGHTVHSLSTLLDDLTMLSLNSVLLPGEVEATIPMLAKPTPLQKRAMELLGVDPHKYVPSARTG